MPAGSSADDASAIPLLEKVAALQRPDAYAPESPTRVDTIKTHMAWAFLTDARVYKLKKLVRYPYLDFSTLDARHWACREDVALNLRLAHGVYLGVAALTREADGAICASMVTDASSAGS